MAALLLSACDAGQRAAADFQRDVGRLGDKIGLSGEPTSKPKPAKRSSKPSNGAVVPAQAKDTGKRPASGMLYDRMADTDVVLAAKLLQDVMEKARDAETRSWKNSRNGHSGSIQPVRSYTTAGGLRCRDYRETLAIDGETDTYTNTACRNENGRWLWTE